MPMPTWQLIAISSIVLRWFQRPQRANAGSLLQVVHFSTLLQPTSAATVAGAQHCLSDLLDDDMPQDHAD